MHPTVFGALAAWPSGAVTHGQICGGAVDRTVFLVRHPLVAAWSDFQRAFSKVGDAPGQDGGHQAALKRNGRWHSAWRAAMLTYAADWASMWKPGKKMYADWLAGHRGANHTLVVRFEDLANTSTRDANIEAILDFAGAPAPADRLACAAFRSDHPAIHRPKAPGSVKAKEAWPAYLVAKAWAAVRTYAVPLGYTKGLRARPISSDLTVLGLDETMLVRSGTRRRRPPPPPDWMAAGGAS